MTFVNELEILKKKLTPQEFEICKKIAEGNEELTSYKDLEDKLFDLYYQGELRGEMPYDTAKARNQTPDVWISNRLEKLFQKD